MKKVILHAVGLSVIGFVIGWFLWHPEVDFLIARCMEVDADIQLVTTTMEGMFLMGVKYAISYFILPWLAMLTHWGIVRFKQAEWSVKTFYKALGFILVGYVIFTVLFVLSLLYTVKNSTRFSISGSVQNDFSIESLHAYKWAVWGAVISCGLCFLLIKKTKGKD